MVFSCFVWGLYPPCFAPRHARRPFPGFLAMPQGHSKCTGDISTGLVLTNHGSFEHSNTAMVHGTPKCTIPPTFSEIRAISFSSKILITLDHHHSSKKLQPSERLQLPELVVVVQRCSKFCWKTKWHGFRSKSGGWYTWVYHAPWWY